MNHKVIIGILGHGIEYRNDKIYIWNKLDVSKRYAKIFIMNTIIPPPAESGWSSLQEDWQN